MTAGGSQASRGLVDRVMDALASRPMVFDALRWVLDAGFKGEKRVVRQERLPAAGRVLDFGCGTGVLAGLFDAARYVGVDLNPRYVARARARHPRHRFAVMEGQHLAMRAASFDAVLIGGVIHHVADDLARRMLAEVRRVLKPATGRLVMWEDVHTRSRWNVVGRLVHRLDQGDHIRSTEQYLDLARSVFGVVDRYEMSSGVCDYVVVVGQPS